MLPEFTTAQWLLGAFCAVLVGFSKTGISGLGILAIPLMAEIFPARESTGVLLPMLIVGDIMAVSFYRRDALWSQLVRLLPWVMPGILLGYFALGWVNDSQMRPILGWLILVLLVLQIVRRWCGDWMEHKLPHTWWFAAVLAILAGFATMLANAAGPIMIMYFLAKKLPKKEFIGTSAWFYLIVNLIKVPFSGNQGLITGDHLLFNAWLAPVILTGAAVGYMILPKVPQKFFDRAVLALAFVASIRMILA